MKRFLLIIISLIVQLPLSAQQRMILKPDGRLNPVTKGSINREIRHIDKHKVSGTGNSTIDYSRNNFNSPPGDIDTLRLPGPSWASNQFVFYSQEWLLQWLQCPTDLILKKVGFSCGYNDANASVEVKVVKVNWSYEDIFNAPVEWHGWYEASGNGFNDITAFLDNPDRTGSWISEDGGKPQPFREDIWSICGIGDTIVPTVQPDGSHYDWVNISKNQEVILSRGEIFGVALHHLGTDLNNTDDEIGFYYNDFDIGGWKFYANGRYLVSPAPEPDWGWWSREYSWDFVAEIQIGSGIPDINSFTQIPSGLDKGPFNIYANITDFAAGPPDPVGIDSAYIQWSNDDGNTWHNKLMYGVEPDYSGVIPEQPPNTTVIYRIVAVDVTSIKVYSRDVSFYIFGPISANLIIFNGLYGAKGFPQDYYFGSSDPANPTLNFDRDVWAYGPLTENLVNNYKNIIEICTSGPDNINSNVIRQWLEADATHNYMVMGDEWLTSQISGEDTTYHSGDFQYDMLGIQNVYNDISYAISGDQDKSSVVYPQNSLLCSDLLQLYNKISTDSNWTAPMLADPYALGGVPNWLDGVDFLSDVEVDIKGLAVDGTTIYDIGGHRTLSAGNKIAFFAFDGLSLDSHTENGSEYYWYGFTNVSPQVKVLDWFGIPLDVKRIENKIIPSTFKLYQNYPNPFNPITKIRYRIPETGFVTLKVYDILGRDVATLVNGYKPAGNYELEFDASSLSSGVYFYRLTAGTFTTTKQMILLR